MYRLAYSRDELLKAPSELQHALALEPDSVKCAAVVRGWQERVMGKFSGADCEDRSCTS
jgi:hypothetical protein